MTNRTKWIIGAVSLLAAFFIGFLPQYRTASGLRSELRAAQEEVHSLRAKAQISELRDLISMTCLAANAKNYGVARQISSRFFTRVGEVSAGTSDEALKTLLSEIYEARDPITAGLAEGRSAVQADIETLVRRLYEETMN